MVRLNLKTNLRKLNKPEKTENTREKLKHRLKI